MTEKGIMDIAIYLRKSREEEEKGLATLDKHRTELLAVAKRGGYNVIDLFEEIVSGEYIAERPEMQSLLINMRDHRYDGVLVMDVDRLGRGNKIDQGRIEKAFKDTDTLIITPNEIIDMNSEAGEFSMEVRTFISRMEFKQIKKRLQGGRTRAAKSGKDIGRKPPYGYDKGADKVLQINEEEAYFVRLIYAWCLAGMGRVQIAHRLTEMGVPSPSGRSIWSHVTVRKILENPKYKGDQTYRRVQWKKHEDGRYTTRKINDPAQFTAKEGAHAAIIDPITWEQVQAAIKGRFRAPVKSSTELVNPFASIMRCKKCGNAILANNPKNRPNIYLYCDTPACEQKMVALSRLIEEITPKLAERISIVNTEDNGEHTHSPSREEAELTKRRITKLRDDLEKAKKRKSNLHDLFEDGTYDRETFVERNRVVSAQIEQVSASIAEETSRYDRLVAEIVTPIDIETVRQAFEAFRDPDATAQEKNEALKIFVKEIRYNRERGPRSSPIELEISYVALPKLPK